MLKKDKLMHTLVTGKTGTGKSNLLKVKILQEIDHSHGATIVFDPNGDLIDDIVVNISPARKKDVIVIDPSDPNCPYGYNPIKNVPDEQKPRVVSEIIEIFQRLYGTSPEGRLSHILRHCLYLLLEQKWATLADIPKLLVDEEFRYQCRLRTKKEFIHDFWMKEFPKYRADALLPLLSRLTSFVNHPAIRRTLIEPKHDLMLRKVMDNNKVILVAISKGKLGSDVSSFIGSLLLTSLSLAVYAKADTPEWKRGYVSLYLDEFQNFTCSSLVGMFAEVRKYNLAITVATQRLSSLRQDIRDAVLGNVGTLITFRVSYDEARILSKYLYPVFTPEMIASLPNYTTCLVMMINGTLSAPFWARTITMRNVIEKTHL